MTDNSSSEQLRTEAVARKHNAPALTSIRTVIVEPWITHDPVVCDYTEESLAIAEAEILGYVEDTKWKSEKRVAGPWCKFCGARSHCQEARNYVGRLHSTAVAVRDSLIELPKGEKGAAIIEPVKTARKIITGIVDAYKALLKVEPDAIPGWYLWASAAKRNSRS